ncbi:MAG: DUF6809 family protein [Flavonifractor plautii]
MEKEDENHVLSGAVVFRQRRSPMSGKSPSKSYAEGADRLSADLEQTLMDQSPTPQRELFVQYTDAWGTLNALSDLDCFVCGFRLGAQMALDAFKND